MAQRLNLSPSLVSHHLRLLRAARLLQAERQGRQVFYQVTDEHVLRTLGDMVDHVAEEHDLEAP
jgi:ArsR family transcriptional regulator